MTAGPDQPAFVESHGYRLAIRRRGVGVPLVFLHGLGSDSRDVLSNLGQPPGLSLVVPDQRGHGLSTPEARMEAFSLSDLVGDVRAVTTALSLDRPLVGGGSMGAAVALRYALDDPHACPALVLVAPALGADPPLAGPALLIVADRIESIGLPAVVAELRAGLRAMGGGPGGDSPTGADPDGHADGDADHDDDGDEDEDGLDAWLRQDPRTLVAAMRSVDRWRPLSDLGELRELTMPVAIVAVRDDPLHPLSLAERFHAELPDSALSVFDSPDEARRPGAMGAAVPRLLADLGVLMT